MRRRLILENVQGYIIEDMEQEIEGNPPPFITVTEPCKCKPIERRFRRYLHQGETFFYVEDMTQPIT